MVNGVLSRRRASLIAGLFAVALSLGCDDSPTTAEYRPVDRFDEVWTRYELAYPSFPVRTVDWDEARAKWRPAADTASSIESLAGVVLRLLGELQDRQAAVVSPSGRVYRAFRPEYVENLDEDRWAATLAGRSYIPRNGGNWGTAVFGDIAYIRIDDFENGGGTSFLAEWDGAITALSPARALILDLRAAATGEELLMVEALSRFTTTPIVAGYARFRDGRARDSLGPFIPRLLRVRGTAPFTRPIVVIAGRGTFALGESALAGLRELPHVTVVGDTTLGSVGNPEIRPLAERWSFSIQRWLEYTADRTVIEGRGIAPDEFVAWNPATELAGDPLLAHALARAAALADSL